LHYIFKELTIKALHSVIIIRFSVKIWIESIIFGLLKSNFNTIFLIHSNYQNRPCFVSFVKFWSTKLRKNVRFKTKNVLLIFLLSFAKILWLQNFLLVSIISINLKLAVFCISQNCPPLAGPYLPWL